MDFKKIYKQSKLKETTAHYLYKIVAYDEELGQERFYASRKDDILEAVHTALKLGFEEITITKAKEEDDNFNEDF